MPPGTTGDLFVARPLVPGHHGLRCELFPRGGNNIKNMDVLSGNTNVGTCQYTHSGRPPRPCRPTTTAMLRWGYIHGSASPCSRGALHTDMVYHHHDRECHSCGHVVRAPCLYCRSTMNTLPQQRARRGPAPCPWCNTTMVVWWWGTVMVVLPMAICRSDHDRGAFVMWPWYIPQLPMVTHHHGHT